MTMHVVGILCSTWGNRALTMPVTMSVQQIHIITINLFRTRATWTKTAKN